MNVTNRILRGRTFDFIVYHRLARNCLTALENTTNISRKQNVKRKYASRMHFAKSDLMKADVKVESPELFQYYEICSRCHTGIYHYLPLGQRALEKLIRVIDEEMDNIGAQKISMSTLAPAALWKKTGRWNTTELFKLKDRHGKEFCLCPTHEESITSMVAEMGRVSHKCLPLMLYQITRKFRDEMHPRYAFLRGREFEMKDLYTFDKDAEGAKQTYDQVCTSYHNIFERLGLQHVKVAGDTGNIGGNLSHEFHLQAPIGEDIICTCTTCDLKSNLELIAPEFQDHEKIGCKKPDCQVERTTAIEVGHAFLLGTKYSKPFNARCELPSREVRFMQMGCYGLGVSRLLQASVEVLRNGQNIVWPSLIAPHQVCIVPQMEGHLGEEFKELSDDLSDKLTSLPNLRGEVVIDDRTKKTVGGRLAAAKQCGYPFAVVVNKKTVEKDLYEVNDLVKGDASELSLDQLIDKFSAIETV